MSITIFVDEVLFEILLNSDIDTIKNLCSINKITKSLCNSYFWHFKYKKDGINYFEDMKFTLNEYNYIYEKNKHIKNLMQYKSIRLYSHNFINFIQLEDESPLTLSNIIKEEYGDVNIKDYHMLMIEYPKLMSYKIIGNCRMIEISHNIKNVKLLLSKIFYLYPNICYVTK